MSNSLKFADMNDAQRGKWLAWANSHDWGGARAEYVIASTGEIAMKTQCACFDKDGTRGVETAIHFTPRELRDWAGY